MRTPTRVWALLGPGSEGKQLCRLCRCEERASARHLWAVCPYFARARRELEAEFDIPAGWWALQPRCTAKSGWITWEAAGTARARVARQLAACRMGILGVAEGVFADSPPGSGA